MDRATARTHAIAAYHFSRMWAERHTAATGTFATGEECGPAERRESCRAAVRVMRTCRARAEA